MIWNKQSVMGCATTLSSQVSQLLLLELVAELVATWFKVTGNDSGITGNVYSPLLCIDRFICGEAG